HVEYGTGVEPARIRTQPRDQMRHFARGAEPFHRAVSDHRADRIAAETADHARIDRTRSDTVYEDVIACKLATECLGERDQRRSGSRVSSERCEPFLSGQ